MSLSTTLRDAMQQLALPHSEAQLTALLRLLEALMKWNVAYNLTAIRDPNDALILHLLDSLSVLPHLDDAELLDVGTGPGFPALPIAIMRPDIAVHALDSNGKKIRFIRQIAHDLNLKNVTPLHQRVEQHQGRYQQIISRAFTELAPFVSITEHLLTNGGVWLAMKSQRVDSEQLGLSAEYLSETIQLNVPHLQAYRCLVKVRRKTEKI